jgi:hypothetical protein
VLTGEFLAVAYIHPASAMETSSAQPVESIEVDQVVKNENAGEDVEHTHEEARAGEMGLDEQGVTNEQFKALKAVAEMLYNYNVKIKGDE